MPDLKDNWEQRAALCIRDWGLSKVTWLDHVGTARVAFCESGFAPTVLKVSLMPDMIEPEARALGAFGPTLAPKVFALSYRHQALLMSRVSSNRDLSSVYPDAQLEVEIWLRLYDYISARKPVKQGFATVLDWAKIFSRLLDTEIADQIRSLFLRAIELSPLVEGEHLLHGDLHHFNILQTETGEWTFIDPHGLIGNPLYELGAFLRNPTPMCYEEPGLAERLRERIGILAIGLQVSERLVAQYGFFGAIFSIAWDIENQHSEFEGTLRIAQTLLDFADEATTR